MTIFNDSTESFNCQPSENRSILAEELGEIFAHLPESRLVGKLGLDRWVGRSGYPIQVMLRAYLASYFLNLRNTNGLIRRLQEDIMLREICGFDETRPLPDRRTFNRFIDRLELHIDIIEWFIDEVVTQLHDLLPNFGSIIAIDATDVHSHSNCDKRPVSDIEAGFVIKEGASGHRKKWTWGYKLHLIADATYELPIALIVTPGNTREMAEMMPLLRAARTRISWFNPKYVIADRGYDDFKNFEAIVKEFDAEPIIKTRMTSPVFGTSANPHCLGQLPLIYRSWDKNKGIQYRCPDRAGKANCPLINMCSLNVVWIRPGHDYRRFGYRINPNTLEWIDLYSHRTAIERINSRLKYERRLDSHCFRGLGKIEFHCALAVLSLLVGALVRAKQGEPEEIRVCARRIA